MSVRNHPQNRNASGSNSSQGMNTGPSRITIASATCAQITCALGQAEERDEAEHERHAHHQRDEGREEHVHALGHEGHQAPAGPCRSEPCGRTLAPAPVISV